MNVLEKLRDVVQSIRTNREPRKVAENWTLIGRLLSRFPIDQAAAAAAVAAKDIPAIDALVAKVDAMVNPKPTEPAAPAPETPQNELDRALRAFRKRLKVMRLADESKLGGRYTSGGRVSNIDAIMPPPDFPAEVWQALERAGKLKHTGQGFYAEVK